MVSYIKRFFLYDNILPNDLQSFQQLLYSVSIVREEIVSSTDVAKIELIFLVT